MMSRAATRSSVNIASAEKEYFGADQRRDPVTTLTEEGPLAMDTMSISDDPRTGLHKNCPVMYALTAHDTRQRAP